mgnify:FL=1
MTFEEFRRLPRSEQNRRIFELSEHDKLLARMNDTGISPSKSVENLDVTPELWEELKRAFEGDRV